MDAGYRLLAAKFLRKQAKQLRAQFQGIRDAEDIEYIHRARVATRRLRAALKVFAPCFKRKRVARWESAIRRITAKLSDARDKDVQIEFLHGVLSAAPKPACLPGLARLLAHWECAREGLQKKVLKAIRRVQRDGRLDQLEKRSKRILRRGEKKAVRVQSPYAFLQAERNVTDRQEELLAFRDCVEQPENAERHHAMRIALKRLRYTMEISRPLYDKRLDPCLEKVKRLQTLLGDLHDCDVWQDRLDDFTASETRRIVASYGHTRPFERLQPGVDFLRENRRRQREELFREFAAFWRELGDEDFWTNLLTVVRLGPTGPESAKPAPRDRVPNAPVTVPSPAPSPPISRANGDDPHQVPESHALPEAVVFPPAPVLPPSRPPRREPAVL
ncbi:MAG: CHAD domain-containing protein [Pirellulales bacterium]|nr:CHAD domain-containing protein [Pirellulales bacterium]